MAFVSREQVKSCYAKKAAGENGSWNCTEWAHATPSIKDLPKRKMARKRGFEYGGVINPEDFGPQNVPLPRISR